MDSPRSMAGPWPRTRRRDSDCTLTILPRQPGSAGHPVVAQDVVEGQLVMLGALGQARQHEYAGQPEFPARETAAAHATDADRPGRHLAARQFLAGLHVDDMGCRDRKSTRL